MVIQIDGQHEYLLGKEDYPISDNNSPATYDQFIKLRDTLIFSNKLYADKAGRSLIIWTKLDGTPTDTIEVREPNICKMNFDAGNSVPTLTLDESKGTYIQTPDPNSTSPISCVIKKTGRYRITHKEQFTDIPADVTWISTWVRHVHYEDWHIIYTKKRAVFDWEWSTPWEFTKMTAYGYVECDLYKDDTLRLSFLWVNAGDPIVQSLQADSNRWIVEYIDLAYN